MSSSHNNKVKIECIDITSITYVDNSLTITEEQPSSPPPTISLLDNEWSIVLNCGRKASVVGMIAWPVLCLVRYDSF